MRRAAPTPLRRARQRGAAVILALLTVALVAGLAAAAVGDLGVAMDQVTGRHDQAQARQLARGAVDWARNVLAEDARGSTVDHLGEAWAVQVPPTPVEEGELAGEIREQSGRINLNNLVQADGPDLGEMDQFLRLLAILGVGDSQALDLRAALLDWLDADDEPRLPGGAESSWYGAQTPARRAANGPLVAVSELLQVRGFTPQLVARLTPFVVAVPPGSTVNVNTAPAEVLAAFLAQHYATHPIPERIYVNLPLGDAQIEATLAELAERGRPDAVKLPRPMLHSGDLDFSFSGLKTAVLTRVREIGSPDDQQRADIARGFQDAIVEVLVKKSMRAVKESGLKRLVVAGGVGANRELRRQLDTLAKKAGISVFYPELEFCTDNGAMIAQAGALRFQAGLSIKPAGAFAVRPRWPLAELTA